MISRTVEGPWCHRHVLSTECTVVWLVGALPYACDDFWRYFDWVQPKAGEEMRLVFSNVHVRGAEKTLIRNTEWGREVVGPADPDGDLWIFPSMRADLLVIEPRVLFEFNVWWWPEYRKGEMK